MNNKDLIEAYKHIFDSEAGKKVLEDMEAMHGYHDPSIVPNDPISTGYRDGEKTPIRRIHKILKMKENENGREAARSTDLFSD